MDPYELLLEDPTIAEICQAIEQREKELINRQPRMNPLLVFNTGFMPRREILVRFVVDCIRNHPEVKLAVICQKLLKFEEELASRNPMYYSFNKGWILRPEVLVEWVIQHVKAHSEVSAS